MKNTIQEIQRIQGQLDNTLLKLSNTHFLAKSPKEIVDKELQKRQDFIVKLEMLNTQWNSQYNNLLNYFGDAERISWHIQYLREGNTKLPLYEEEWFIYVYREEIDLIELEQLYNKIKI